MSGYTTVYLLRHAESTPNFEQPESDWPLAEEGQQQASRLIKQLNHLQIDVVYSSPYIRAVDTVKPFAEHENLPIGICNDLRERKLAEGFLNNWHEIIQRAWKDFSFALPNCESSQDCQKRVTSCIDQLVQDNLGKTILLSSHGNAIALYLNGVDSSFGFGQWGLMQNPDVYKVIYNGRQKSLSTILIDA